MSHTTRAFGILTAGIVLTEYKECKAELHAPPKAECERQMLADAVKRRYGYDPHHRYTVAAPRVLVRAA